MFKNYWKSALRNLQRNRIYSFINIAGLSLGLACAMLIMLYVKDEVSFDRFHKNVHNIYRVVSKSEQQGKEEEINTTGLLQGPRFTQNVPGIKSFVRVHDGAEDIKTGTDVQSQTVLYVDSSFFSIFTFPLLDGNPKTCLTEPHSMVLSKDAAKKYFGSTDAVGKVMMVKEDSTFVPYKVTAVAKRCPQNSSIQFDVLLPFKESADDENNTANWFSSFLTTYVVLNDNEISVPPRFIFSRLLKDVLNPSTPINSGKKSRVNFSNSSLKNDFLGFGATSSLNWVTSCPNSSKAFRRLK